MLCEDGFVASKHGLVKEAHARAIDAKNQARWTAWSVRAAWFGSIVGALALVVSIIAIILSVSDSTGEIRGATTQAT